MVCFALVYPVQSGGKSRHANLEPACAHENVAAATMDPGREHRRRCGNETPTLHSVSPFRTRTLAPRLPAGGYVSRHKVVFSIEHEIGVTAKGGWAIFVKCSSYARSLMVPVNLFRPKPAAPLVLAGQGCLAGVPMAGAKRRHVVPTI